MKEQKEEQKKTSREISNANLIPKPWPKGQSGNPNGRPKGAKDGIRAQLNRMLKTTAPDQVLEKLKKIGMTVGGKSNARAIAATMLAKALSGDIEFLKEVLKQTEIPLDPKGGDVNVIVNNGEAKSGAEQLLDRFAEIQKRGASASIGPSDN